MLTSCYVGPPAFGETLLQWFSKPPIPIHVQLILDVKHHHDFLIVDIRGQHNQKCASLPMKCRRCVWIATQDKTNIVHEAAVSNSNVSRCALLTDTYCPPIMVWMACIMQQCHDKVVNLNDVSVSRRVFGKVHDATQQATLVMLLDVNLSSTLGNDMWEPMLVGHNVVNCKQIDDHFKERDLDQPFLCVVFKRQCIADASMIDSLCMDVSRQSDDVVRPCVHMLPNSIHGPVAMQRLHHLDASHAKEDDHQVEPPVLAFNHLVTRPLSWSSLVQQARVCYKVHCMVPFETREPYEP